MAGGALDYQFAEGEHPRFPGSPYSPRHSPGRRAAYICSAMVLGMTAGLGNALVTTSITTIQGEIGLYTAEAAWLLAVYVAFNAAANLALIKARVQFGIPRVTFGLLLLLIASQVAVVLRPSIPLLFAARAIEGLTAGGLTTLTLYSGLQVAPPKWRPAAILIASGIPQLAVPIARLFPIEALGLHDWRGLHLVDVGMAVAALAMLNLVPLPPTDRSRAFEPLDGLTFSLFASAMVLLCGALAVGRYVWWQDTSWLGLVLAIGVPLLALALFIESRRRNPALQVDWIGSSEILRFALVTITVRIALAEQTYGAVGLLNAGGLTNDQMHLLFALVFGAMALGYAVGALTLKPERILIQVVAASLLIATGAGLDSYSTNVTRAPQLILSQCLIGLGASLYYGPGMVFGYGKMMARGSTHLVSYVVLFSTTQNVGGLAGSALLGSYQIMQARAHAEALAEHLSLGDPQVVQRLQQSSHAISGALTDPVQQGVQGSALLGQALNLEANVLAYNDTFRLVMWIAIAVACFLLTRIGLPMLRARLHRKAQNA